MKRNFYVLLSAVLFFSLTFFTPHALLAESINALQQNLNASEIAAENASSSGVQNAAETAGESIKSAANSAQQSMGECANQLKTSCSGFFGKLKSIFQSFFQNIFSMFKQIVRQIGEAFKGCSGQISNIAGEGGRQDGGDSSTESSGNQAADDNSGANAGNQADGGEANSGQAQQQEGSNNSNGSANNGANQPPANENQGSQPERPAGNDSAVDTNNAQSLIKTLKEKFNITIENGTSQWSLSQLQQAYQTLTKLPPSFIAQTNMIQRISTTNLGPNVGGYVSSGAPRVYVTDHGTRSMTFVLVHEMAHCFHFAKRDVFAQWESQFWGGRSGYSGRGTQLSPSVSSYGNGNSMEDFAESVRAYYMNGPSMKRTHPDRYEFVKKYVMAGVEY
ncbi:MAG TPA: hypothetical protein PK467_15690 [Candidatus Wallbacteria bacterium]|nr:hypothetical protein [Candidatus Wallbacteria bacterium]